MINGGVRSHTVGVSLQLCNTHQSLTIRQTKCKKHKCKTKKTNRDDSNKDCLSSAPRHSFASPLLSLPFNSINITL